jgi:Protein of unknown function (DUF3667)
MTDVVTAAPPVPDAARCANCGAALYGAFCAACGQAAKPLDPPVRHFIGEFAQEFFDVDGRVLRSFRRLFLSPGFLTREHVEGRRAPWVSPLKLYLLASVAMFAVLATVGNSSGVRLWAVGDPNDPQGFQPYGYSSFEEMRAAVDAARVEWMPRVMFVLVPFVAWLVALARRRSKRHYPAHLVFTLHVYAAAFGARAVAAALGAAGPPALAEGLVTLTWLYAVGYTYVALRRAYGISRSLAVRDAAIVTLGAWVALMAGTAAVVAVAVWGRYWLTLLGL